MKTCVLFNPRAGSAGPIDALRDAIAADPAVSLLEVGPDDDLVQLVAKAVCDGFDVVAVAGGDGSVHAAANGLLQAKCDAALAVIPLGTGNDFARTLAVPLDPVAAVELLRTGTPRTLDAVKVEGTDAGFMVNVATGGFSGLVTAGLTPELKRSWGPLAYLRGAVGPLADPPRFRLDVRFDGGPPEPFEVLNVVVANARTAGGGLSVAPTANPEDGQLDVILVRADDALDLSVIAARLMHGDYTHDENVRHRLAARVEFTSDPPITLSIDGELVEGSRFAFTVVPRALRVLTGPEYHPAPPPESPIDDDEDEPVPAVAPAVQAVEKTVGQRLFGLVAGLLLLVKRTPRETVIGFGLIAVAVLAFAWLANGVEDEQWVGWNDRLRQAWNPGTQPGLEPLAAAVTWLGGWGTAVVAVAVLGLFLGRKQYVNAATFVAVLLGVGVLELVLKPLFGIARPPFYPTSPVVLGYSFPSGHALRGVGVFGFLAALTAARGYRRGQPGWWLLTALCGLLAVGVCWSRIYLGVHWPTDVVAGGIAAAAWVTACLVARHSAMTRPSPS
jgi:diacylglycerol kinase (ATP)